MCKKACIAGLVVLLSAGVIGLTGSKAGSYIRLYWNKFWTKVESKVPLETKLERLEQLLKEMERDERHFADHLAKDSLKVEKRQEEIEKDEKAQVALKERIDALNAALNQGTSGTKVSYLNKEWDRDEVVDRLKIYAENYLDAQARLKNANLGLRRDREALRQGQTRLRAMRAEREKALAKVKELRNALMEERRTQVAGEGVDDSGARTEFRKGLEEAQDEISLMRKKREVYTNSGQDPFERAEKETKKKAEVEAFIRSLNQPPAAGAQTKR